MRAGNIRRLKIAGKELPPYRRKHRKDSSCSLGVLSTEQPTLARLTRAFLKIGALGFGGPFALLALMEKELVVKRRWLTAEEFAESTAVGTLTPGPIFFAAAVHAGYRLKGLPGAFTAAGASLLPGFVAAVAIAALYLRVELSPWIRGAMAGLGAAVTGLLAVATFRTAKSLIRKPFGIALAVASFALLVWGKLHPVLVIVLAGGAAMVVHGRGRPAAGPKQGEKKGG